MATANLPAFFRISFHYIILPSLSIFCHSIFIKLFISFLSPFTYSFDISLFIPSTFLLICKLTCSPPPLILFYFLYHPIHSHIFLSFNFLSIFLRQTIFHLFLFYIIRQYINHRKISHGFTSKVTAYTAYSDRIFSH